MTSVWAKLISSRWKVHVNEDNQIWHHRLTNSSKHLFSLMAPQQPRKPSRNSILPMARITYTPVNRSGLAATISLKPIGSNSTHMPTPNRKEPPNWEEEGYITLISGIMRLANEANEPLTSLNEESWHWTYNSHLNFDLITKTQNFDFVSVEHP